MKLQSIIFPTNPKHQTCRNLFYKGDQGILSDKDCSLKIAYAQFVDFATYFNACYWRKLRELTRVGGGVTLKIKFQGKIRVAYVGYTRQALNVDKRVFTKKDYTASKPTEITFTFPENSEQMLGFEVTALGDSTIYGGGYYAEVDDGKLQPVCLSIATTTCRKEEFIKKNVAAIQKEILEQKDEVAENIYLHVIDNGRTLSEADVAGKHTYLHPNPNTGGSGGFARGMLESLAQKPAATHVLLMDDDVLVLPESIRRTYTLLRLLKPKYRQHMVSGAMLYYEDPTHQHEDIGTVQVDETGWYFRPMKPQFDHEDIAENLDCAYGYPPVKNSYSAWWYCCLPVSVIKKQGLPLPLFIRCDDAEYGLRCRTGLIAMNGICIWHMGFVTKYNGAMDVYQQTRNLAIAKAVTNILPTYSMDDILLRAVTTKVRKELLQFNYGGVELTLRALEDYLRGPEFLMQADGEAIVKENAKLNDQMLPLEEFEDECKVNKSDIYDDPGITWKDRWLARLTWNGQRFCPDFLCDDQKVVAISFDEAIQLHRIVLKNKLLAVNPYSLNGALRVKDRRRFRELYRRYKRDLRELRRHGEAVAKEYAAQREYLTSEEFWREYLGLSRVSE